MTTRTPILTFLVRVRTSCIFLNAHFGVPLMLELLLLQPDPINGLLVGFRFFAERGVLVVIVFNKDFAVGP